MLFAFTDSEDVKNARDDNDDAGRYVRVIIIRVTGSYGPNGLATQMYYRGHETYVYG